MSERPLLSEDDVSLANPVAVARELRGMEILFEQIGYHRHALLAAAAHLECRRAGPSENTAGTGTNDRAEARSGRREVTAFSVDEKAFANLLDAVEGVLWFSWADSDLDEDAARAIDRLRLARDEYGTVQRIKNG